MVKVKNVYINTSLKYNLLGDYLKITNLIFEFMFKYLFLQILKDTININTNQ